MTKRIFFMPYKMNSAGLAEVYENMETEAKRIRTRDSKYKEKDGDIIINWGHSTYEPKGKARILNHPEAIARVSNKKRFFRTIDDIPEEHRPSVPPWTTDKQVVRGWVQDGKTVFARTKLTGHSGQGIVVLTPDDFTALDGIANNTLFTQYVKKRHEYRVHFFGGEIVDTQRKARRTDVENPNWLIRSFDNGFVFARNDGHELPEVVRNECMKLINALDLDFGAIDVGYNQLRNEAVIYEVNTAPGVEGTTAEIYARKVDEYVKN